MAIHDDGRKRLLLTQHRSERGTHRSEIVRRQVDVGLSKDLDAALAWAEKCPSVEWGTIEIRPTAVRFASGEWVPAT